MTAAPRSAPDGAPLALRDVRKRFGPVTALDGASLAVAAGTVHALLGENGAGKSTLVRVAFGLVRPDAGTLLVDGTARRFAHSADAIAAGIGMVHQHFSLVPAMTAAENVALGGRGRFDRRAARERLAAVAADAGLAVDPDARVEDMPVAAQQRLEILKALVRGARVLMLDEPTAVLAPREIDELTAWLRRFVAAGNAAVLITHKLGEALAVADDVTVLRRGRTVLATSARDTSTDALARAMLGEGDGETETPGSASSRATRDPHLPTIAAAESVTVRDGRGVVVLRDVSLTLAAGEIVGVAAVEGSGQHALLRVLAGRLAPAAGTVRLPPPERVAFVPEDRHRDALALDFTLAENVALRGSGARRGIVRWDAVSRATSSLMAAHDVRAAGPAAAVRTLSGGNQQKLVLARELAGDALSSAREVPTLVVAENPTRGLDVHATVQVHERLRDAAARGAAVVLYSTDLDEVLALAGRVLVLHAGEARVLPPDRDAVGRAMLGAP